MKQEIAIIGAGGLGREILAMIKGSSLNTSFEPLGFIDDGKEAGEQINGVPVLGGITFLLKAKEEIAVAIGIGNPQVRYKVYEQLKSNANLSFPNLIHPNASLHAIETIQMGIGNIIADGCILTSDIHIGDLNLLNLGCLISHDAMIGNYCTLMHHTCITGGAKLGDGVFLGTGVKLIKPTFVADNATIIAGSIIAENIGE